RPGAASRRVWGAAAPGSRRFTVATAKTARPQDFLRSNTGGTDWLGLARREPEPFSRLSTRSHPSLKRRVPFSSRPRLIRGGESGLLERDAKVFRLARDGERVPQADHAVLVQREQRLVERLHAVVL